MTTPKKPEGKKFSDLQITLMNIVRGGIAGCIATASVIPLDVTKTWLQLQSESGAAKIKVLDAMRSIFATKGIRGFYAGLDSGLARQFGFAGIRIGLFFNVVDLVQKKLKRNLNITEKIIASLSVGALAAFVVNPFDVVLVRSWADVKRPVNERRNYKNVLNGIARITREEGISTLWRAATPNIARAVGLNLGMMVSYQELKERLRPYLGDSFGCHLTASIVAGLCGTTLALPFDNIKVKIVNMSPNAAGKMPYKGIIDCLLKSIRREGFFRLWAGFVPVAANLGPHSVISLLSSEIIKKQMIKLKLLPE